MFRLAPFLASAIFSAFRLNDSVGNFEEIREKLVEANLLAERANALLKERRSNVRYHVSLQVPIHCLNQAKRVRHAKINQTTNLFLSHGVLIDQPSSYSPLTLIFRSIVSCNANLSSNYTAEAFVRDH